MKSYYLMTLQDGTILHSDNESWLKHSKKIEARKDNRVKTVYVSNPDIKSIKVFHGELEKELETIDGCQIFQSVVAEHIHSSEGVEKDSILGRIVGLVKDGVVLEEYFLDSVSNSVIGYKYK